MTLNISGTSGHQRHLPQFAGREQFWVELQSRQQAVRRVRVECWRLWRENILGWVIDCFSCKVAQVRTVLLHCCFLVLRANCMLPSHLTSTWTPIVEPLIFAIAEDNTATLEAIAIYLFLSKNFANRCMQQPAALITTAADYTALEAISVYFILGTKIVDQRMPRPVDPGRDCGSWRLRLLPFTTSTNLNDVWFSTNNVVKEDFCCSDFIWLFCVLTTARFRMRVVCEGFYCNDVIRVDELNPLNASGR